MADAKEFCSSTGAVHDYAAIHRIVAERGAGFFLPSSTDKPAAAVTPASTACGTCKSVWEPITKKQVNECTNRCKAG